MKLHNVTHISGLFNVLDHSRDDVTITMADGADFDWSTEKDVLRSMIASLEVPQLGSMALQCKNKKDTNDVMNFLMECRSVRRAA